MMRPRPRPTASLLSLLAVALAAAGAAQEPVSPAAAEAAPAVAAPAPAVGPAFKVYVEEEGVYRLAYEELAAAGLPAGDWASTRIAADNRGRPVPLAVDDGGDGVFGAGDRLAFVGERLAGERSYYDEQTSDNVYWLRFDAPVPAPPPEPVPVPSPDAGPADAAPAALEVHQHFEEDRVLLRFSPDAEGKTPEPWYWAKLTHLDKPPLQLTIDLADRDPDSPRPVALAVGLRGWSAQSRPSDPPLPDHRVEVLLNDRPVGSAEWSGQDAATVEVPEVPAEALVPGENVLTLSVPKRWGANATDPVIDVQMLNWVEVRYPRTARIGGRQARIDLAAAPPDATGAGAAGGTRVVLESAAGTDLAVFAGGGRRLTEVAADSPGAPESPAAAGDTRRHLFDLPAGETRLYAVPGGAFRAPAAVELDRPSDLRARTAQVDYLILAHRSLLAAVEPLAGFHRRRGLAVETVDVEDVYDEFSDGILDAASIRAFLSDAYHRRQKPAPRYVLLVGDASWDPKNLENDDLNYADWTYRPGESRRFVKNASTPYAGRPAPANRNLVPTWHFESSEGHAASDNWFVAVDGDDTKPDLAIGRFPVTEPAEVEAIVAKTIRYVEASGVGPWRRRILWITSEQSNFQMLSDRLVAKATDRGFDALKVYPAEGQPAGEQNEDLRRALDEGELVVHFFGHGGRYIWRTGPPDLQKQRDLFTPDDVDRLAPSDRLPVIVSMTCYSAPFDHPTADSIGEKFLRAAGRGAVAVLAASWRVTPVIDFSWQLLDGLTRPGTVGEAMTAAKRESNLEEMVQMFNLLGDPAAPIAAPRLAVRLAEDGRRRALAVEAEVETPRFHGEAIADWIGEGGEVVASERIAVDRSRFALRFPGPAEEREAVRAVHVYVWNQDEGLDGLGRLDFAAPEGAGAPPPAGQPAGQPASPAGRR